MYLKIIEEGGPAMNDKISVIIRSINDSRWLGHTIQSVLDFLNKPEIIIVDNNSSDETENIVRHFTGILELRRRHFGDLGAAPSVPLSLSQNRPEGLNIFSSESFQIILNIFSQNWPGNFKAFRTYLFLKPVFKTLGLAVVQ